LLSAFRHRGITYIADRLVRALDPQRHSAALDDGSEMPYDLFLGIPKHRVPDVVAASGMTRNGWVPVNPKTLETGAARIVAAELIANIKGGEKPGAYKGDGTCYVEFGAGQVGRIDVDFLSGPNPTGTYTEASVALVGEKKDFGASRRAKWFGL
jgi:sulfide:quinone oxidoreductase